VTITIQASEREHALITTNPVELAESANVSPEQYSMSSLDTAPQLARESHEHACNGQHTMPLRLIQEQAGDEDTVKIRTNHYRQPAQHPQA
jgi:hypothetical protein